MPTATWGGGGQGMEMGYTIAPTPLGHVLVAGTVKGISAIYLGESHERLEATLRREYPAATISKNPAQVSQWVRQLVGHLSGEQPELDLPLDVKATAFQRRDGGAHHHLPPPTPPTRTRVESRPWCRRKPLHPSLGAVT